MTQFQKDAIREYFQKRGQEQWVSDLFYALDVKAIDFKPLALPIINLDLERFIPSGQVSSVVKGCDIDSLMRSAIVFDLYIPSKKWVANLSTSSVKNSSYLRDAINSSVGRTMNIVKGNSITDPLMKKEDGKIITLTMVLEDAVMAYLTANGITHPLDRIPALSQPQNDAGMLLSPENIDKFVSQILK
ncbi:MAG: hypothetical protein K2K86_05145 [Muribaculaceae bacterium]|nr:hypothetical protein [Muribaculaceae bacterium]